MTAVAQEGAPSPTVGPAGEITQGSTARGAVWLTASRAAIQVLQLLASVVLAHLLGPGEYGVVAIVWVFTAFAGMFSDLGLGPAVVAAPTLEEPVLATAFWLNAGTGIGLAGLVCALAWPLGHAFDRPTLGPLLALGSLTFALALGTVHLALLERAGRFGVVAVVETAAALAGSGLTIALAATGAGAVSLVAGPVLTTAAATACFWFLVPWRPHSRPGRAAAQHLWTFTGPVMRFSVVQFWSRNVDSVLLGKVTTAADLGLYSRAYNLMMVPLFQVAIVLGRVLLPALAPLHEDVPRIRQAYAGALRVVALTSWPVGALLAATSPTFVRAIYGERWTGMTPLLALLAVSVPPQVVTVTATPLYQAMHRTDLLARRGSLVAVISVVGIAAGLPWGARGVSAGFCVTAWLVLPYSVAQAWRLIRLSPGVALRATAGAATVAVLGATAATLVRLGVGGLAPWQLLALELAAGLLASAFALWLAEPAAWASLGRLLGGRLGLRPGQPASGPTGRARSKAALRTPRLNR